MGAHNTPRTPSRTEQRRSTTVTGEDALPTEEGLGKVLSEITNQTRQDLRSRSLGGSPRAEEGLLNPLYGINLQRGSIGWDDVNVRTFKPRQGEVMSTMVGGEIERMRSEHHAATRSRATA